MQNEESFLFDALLQPPADLIEQRVFLAVDLAAGRIVGAPGFFPLGFKAARGALPLQFFRKRTG